MSFSWERRHVPPKLKALVWTQGLNFTHSEDRRHLLQEFATCAEIQATLCFAHNVHVFQKSKRRVSRSAD